MLKPKQVIFVTCHYHTTPSQDPGNIAVEGDGKNVRATGQGGYMSSEHGVAIAIMNSLQLWLSL